MSNRVLQGSEHQIRQSESGAVAHGGAGDGFCIPELGKGFKRYLVGAHPSTGGMNADDISEVTESWEGEPTTIRVDPGLRDDALREWELEASDGRLLGAVKDMVRKGEIVFLIGDGVARQRAGSIRRNEAEDEDELVGLAVDLNTGFKTAFACCVGVIRPG